MILLPCVCIPISVLVMSIKFYWMNLFVTSSLFSTRAMELGRECLKLWGYVERMPHVHWWFCPDFIFPFPIHFHLISTLPHGDNDAHCFHHSRYERIDELIWVKTNQLQRIIRTGRTGHWLNHGKEHCLVRDLYGYYYSSPGIYSFNNLQPYFITMLSNISICLTTYY